MRSGDNELSVSEVGHSDVSQSYDKEEYQNSKLGKNILDRLFQGLPPLDIFVIRMRFDSFAGDSL